MVRIRLADATEAVPEARRWPSGSACPRRLPNAMPAPWERPREEDAVLLETPVAARPLGAGIGGAQPPSGGRNPGSTPGLGSLT